MADERELIARLRLIYDQQSAQQAEQSVKGLQKGIGSASVSTKDLTEGLKKIGIASAAVTATAGLMVAKYQQTAGLGESTSRAWALGAHDLEMQYVSMGRTVEQVVLPYLQQAVDLAKKAADAMAQNPAAVKTGLQLAGAGVALGTVAKFVGTGNLLALGKSFLSTVAAGASTAAGPILLGAGAGLMGTNALSQTAVGKQAGVQPIANTLAVGAYEVGKLFGGEKQGESWFKNVAQLTGAIQGLGATSQTASSALGVMPQEMQLYTQYLRQEAQAEQQRNIQVTRTTRDFYRQQIYEAADFQLQQSRQLRDFNYQQLTQEQDYYRQRMINARDFGIETTRMEEDHQKEIKRAQEDYQYNLWDILRSGDALAYMRAQHDYNLQRSRSEEDYQVQVSRRNQDYALQLSDQETQYKIMRSRQLVEFQRQQGDQQQDFNIRRARTAEQFAITMSDMQQDFNLQRQYRRQAFDDQLRDLSGFWTNMANVSAYFEQGMITDYLKMLDKAKTGADLITPTNGQRASGGPVLPGQTYTVGENGIEILRMGASGGYVYNPRGTSGMGDLGGSRYVKAEITVAMDGDNWTPALESRVGQKIIDVVSAAMGG